MQHCSVYLSVSQAELLLAADRIYLIIVPATEHFLHFSSFIFEAVLLKIENKLADSI